MSELLVSIGFDLIAMGLTAGYIAKLILEQFSPASTLAAPQTFLANCDSLVSEASVQKRSLLSQSVFRRIR